MWEHVCDEWCQQLHCSSNKFVILITSISVTFQLHNIAAILHCIIADTADSVARELVEADLVSVKDMVVGQ